MPKSFDIGKRTIGIDHPTYFVADIAANHDGNLEKAIELINLAAESGANAAKFQNFFAETIVSDYGFKSLAKDQLSHQEEWEKKFKKSVYEVYKNASIPLEWTPKLKETCEKAGIDYFTAPYDLSILDELDEYVVAWKVGSGDITWLDLIEDLSARKKPLLIATGASDLEEVKTAVKLAQKKSEMLVLMQCNTNYTSSIENIGHVNLSVLKTYSKEFENILLGLSDHTPGHSTVLGAVALGARVIEKHFTNDCSLLGPDHKFSMNPKTWKEMVKRTRELESALGNGIKKVEDNEKDTVVLQRRALRAAKDLFKGEIITDAHLIPLRPCPPNALTPAMKNDILGKILKININKGDIIKLSDTSIV